MFQAPLHDLSEDNSPCSTHTSTTVDHYRRNCYLIVFQAPLHDLSEDNSPCSTHTSTTVDHYRRNCYLIVFQAPLHDLSEDNSPCSTHTSTTVDHYRRNFTWLCSKHHFMTWVRITAPVLPTPALQWITIGEILPDYVPSTTSWLE